MIPSITQAHKQMRESGISFQTKLQHSLRLSEQYHATVHLKREDQQLTRVFKMRSAFTSLQSLTKEQKEKGVVTVSDGNFAQAFAFFCNHFKIKGMIFVPEVCYGWKIDLIQKNGKQFVEVKTAGENFDECEEAAKKYIKENDKILIHPSDNIKAIHGCGTIGIEILDEMKGDLDYVFLPVGQGALAAGIATYIKAMSPNTKVIGVQPDGADSMIQAFQAKRVVKQEHFSRFCEGSAVPSVPKLCLDICMEKLDQLVKVEEGRVSTTILQLYNQGIAVEPAGALSVSVLDQFAHEIKGKNVVCILSGGTVDLSRFDEFKEHSQLHEGLKYFFLIEMPFKSGILKNFVSFCLGPDDDITHIQFQKKANRERGPCLVAIEVAKKDSIKQVMENMRKMHLQFKLVNDSKELYDLLV
ncbi:unnamed protein product [Paramecium octaurelia]|uniref:ACT-like domain-containing protein n=1 Tax=Paramecium octaurelia TaxID=43137 RepID=A0A8S1X0R5_PAROT|nr:unnamed protein product [Paramecium octaurelia]